MNKTYTVILSIFFIGILIGSYFLFFQKAQIRVGDEHFNMQVTYDSYFIDVNGNKLALVTADGSIVDRYHLEIYYCVNGKEINWDTLTVHVYGKLEITLNEISPENPEGERTLVYNETLLNITTSKRKSSYIIERTADEIIDAITMTLQDNTTITIDIKIRIWATAYDIYAVMRYANWRGYYSKTFIWKKLYTPPGEENTVIETPSEDQTNDGASGETITDYDRGYNEGYNDGYDAGVSDAKAGLPQQYTTYSDHKGTTYEDGYEDGYIDGYIDGYNDASATESDSGEDSGGGGGGGDTSPPTDTIHPDWTVASSLDTEGMRKANTTKAMMIMAFSALLIGAYWVYDTKLAARGRRRGRRR